MALVTEGEVRVRSDGGTRGPVVLEAGEVLSPSARDYLRSNRLETVRVRPALNEACPAEKPEHMTHLRGDVLVEKNHPRIRFRGKIDTLEGEILLCQQTCHALGNGEMTKQLEEILAFVRQCIRFDVLDEPVGKVHLCGYTAEELREHSHHPERYYGQGHFLPQWQDGEVILSLNRLRTLVRETELTAYDAFYPRREDILLALNRLSSLLWILMIREKAKQKQGG